MMKPKQYPLLIKTLHNDNVAIVDQKGNVLYVAQNRYVPFAIEECRAFLSSFNNVTVTLEPQLQEVVEKVFKKRE